MITVYKKSGKALEVNEDMIPHLSKLELSQEKPKATKKPVKKAK